MNLLELNLANFKAYVLFDENAQDGPEILNFFEEKVGEDEIIENELFQIYLQAIESRLPLGEDSVNKIKEVIKEYLVSNYTITAFGSLDEKCNDDPFLCMQIFPLPKKLFKRLKEKALLIITGGLPIPSTEDENKKKEE